MTVQNQITFRKGERLSAQKMNALANLAANLNSPTYARPDGLGFHGDVKWSQNNLNMADPPNKPRFKPFDICPQWDASGKLSAYVVMRPLWQVFEDNEAKVLELSSDVTLKHDEGMDDVSAIYLVQLSAEEDTSESEGDDQSQDEEPKTTDDEWKVLDNVMVEDQTSPHIQNKWLLYKVGGNGLVTLDVRDAFVNLQLSSDVSSDASGGVILDLSSLDWLSSTGYDEQLSAQSWHYNNPEQSDFADADVRPDATGPNRLDSWRFFARPEAGGTVQYVQLSSLVSELSTLNTEISSLSTEISALSSEISAGTSTTITGNVPDSVAIDGDIQVMAMLSSNVSCHTYLDQNNNPIMELGVYYV